MQSWLGTNVQTTGSAYLQNARQDKRSPLLVTLTRSYKHGTRGYLIWFSTSEPFKMGIAIREWSPFLLHDADIPLRCLWFSEVIQLLLTFALTTSTVPLKYAKHKCKRVSLTSRILLIRKRSLTMAATVWKHYFSQFEPDNENVN